MLKTLWVHFALIPSQYIQPQQWMKVQCTQRSTHMEGHNALLKVCKLKPAMHLLSEMQIHQTMRLYLSAELHCLEV